MVKKGLVLEIGPPKIVKKRVALQIGPPSMVNKKNTGFIDRAIEQKKQWFYKKTRSGPLGHQGPGTDSGSAFHILVLEKL